MHKFLLLAGLFFLLGSPLLPAQNVPMITKGKNGDFQLLVHNKPFLMLGGELSNSATPDKERMEVIWPRLAERNINTVLAPVYWELLEPVEGKFDFTLVEAMITQARASDLKLVLLWFGTWKNSMSFAPVTEKEEAGLVLLSDDRFNYIFVVGEIPNGPCLRLYKTENGLCTLLKEVPVQQTKQIYLMITGHDESYDFGYSYHENEYLHLMSELDASLLSSTVNEGFTGTYIGMYASSNKSQSNNYALFDWFAYSPL